MRSDLIPVNSKTTRASRSRMKRPSLSVRSLNVNVRMRIDDALRSRSMCKVNDPYIVGVRACALRMARPTDILGPTSAAVPSCIPGGRAVRTVTPGPSTMSVVQLILLGAAGSILAVVVLAALGRTRAALVVLGRRHKLADVLRRGGITKFHLSRDDYGRTLKTYLSQAKHSIRIVSVSLKLTH